MKITEFIHTKKQHKLKETKSYGTTYQNHQRAGVQRKQPTIPTITLQTQFPEEESNTHYDSLARTHPEKMKSTEFAHKKNTVTLNCI